MADPTRAEMLECLQPAIEDHESDTDSAEIAMYWFAYDYHGGQSSNLYSVLCQSPYSPGPIMNIDKEDEIVTTMYELLVTEFE